MVNVTASTPTVGAVLLSKVCYNNSCRNKKPILVLLWKKQQPDLDFWIHLSSHCSREALQGAERQRWDFPEQQPLSHPAQHCQCKTQPKNGATALNCPRGHAFSRAPHLEVHQCGCSYFPGAATLQRSTKLLRFEFLYQVPTSMHINVFKHHLYNTRVKAVTAIPLERFRDP